jgi:hypothetical protein
MQETHVNKLALKPKLRLHMRAAKPNALSALVKLNSLTTKPRLTTGRGASKLAINSRVAAPKSAQLQ